MKQNDIDLICKTLGIAKTAIREGVEYTLEDIITIDDNNIELIYLAPGNIRSCNVKGVFSIE